MLKYRIIPLFFSFTPEAKFKLKVGIEFAIFKK